jgi:hypothetical protein
MSTPDNDNRPPDTTVSLLLRMGDSMQRIRNILFESEMRNLNHLMDKYDVVKKLLDKNIEELNFWYEAHESTIEKEHDG